MHSHPAYPVTAVQPWQDTQDRKRQDRQDITWRYHRENLKLLFRGDKYPGELDFWRLFIKTHCYLRW